MKKILFILSLLAIAGTASAQFPSKDSAERFINKWIRNSAIDAFTNLRLNQALIYTLRYADSANVISFAKINDSTLRLITKGKDTFTVVIPGGGSGSGTVNTGTQYQLAYYNANGTAVAGNTIIAGSRAIVSDANGLPVASAVTTSELANVGGSTSNLQTQLDGKIGGTLNNGRITLSSGAASVTDESDLTYNSATNKITTDSIRIKASRSDTSFLQNIEYPFNPPDSLLTVGHSIINDLNASPASNSFANLTSATFNLTRTNKAVGGSGIITAAARHNTWLNTVPGSVDHSAITMVMACLNDYRRGGFAPKTRRKTIWGNQAIIANHFLKSWVAAGAVSASITRSGSWTTTYLGTSVGGKSVNNGAYTQTLNDYIEYTATDSTFVLGLIGSDSSGGVYNYSSFELLIDGVSQGLFSEGNQVDGIDDGVFDGKRGPMVIVLRGLSYTSHTIRLINKTASPNFFVVDYFGHLVDATDGEPFLLFHDPHLNATGYATAPANANDGIIDAGNAMLDSLYNEFSSYPIYVVRTNDYYNVVGGIDVDNIHPNNTGHAEINNARGAVLASVTPVFGEGGQVYSEGRFYDNVAGVRRIRAYQDQLLDTTDAILNQNDYNQSAGFSVSDSSFVNNLFSVGNSTMNNTPVFRASMGSDRLLLFSNSGSTTLEAANAARTTSNVLQISATEAQFGPISTGVFAKTLTIKRGLSAAQQMVGIGTNSLGYPYMSWYNTNASTDLKGYDFYTDNSGTLNYRMFNDAAGAANNWLTVTRTGYVPLAVKLGGEVMIGSTTDQGAHILQVTGGFYQNGTVNLRGTNTALVPSYVLFKQSDSTVSQLSGTANQVLGMNSAGTGHEYKTLTGSASVDIAHSAGAVTFSIPTTFADADSYSPTLTAIANVDAVSLVTGTAHYLRIKDEVSVDLALSIDPTAATTTTNVDITLPFASTMTNFENLTGILTADGINGNVAAVGNKARIGFTSVGTGATTFNIHFKYKIQ